MSFSLDVYQDKYLPRGAEVVCAVVYVQSQGGQAAAAPSEKAVVFVVDTSGSMSSPKIKIGAARRAAAAAIELLPDGTLFALVTGNHRASCAYPTDGQRLARADSVTRSEAMDVASRLKAEGGTAMSTWIDLVREMVEPYPDAIRLAYLLSDGKNESENPELLDAALARAAGIFQCDTRGVGDGYVVDELRRISSVLLGTPDGMALAEDMESDFRTFMDRAIGKNIPDVRIRVRTPGSKVRLLRQDFPELEELTDKADPDANDPTVCNYPTGAWAGDEARSYSICLEVRPSEKEKLAAGVTLVVGGKELTDSQGREVEKQVKAVWTDDQKLLTEPRYKSQELARAFGQADVTEAYDQGLKAWEQDDIPTAERWLGRAYALAHAAGNTVKLAELEGLVDVVDAEEGRVTLKNKVGVATVKAKRMKSRRTVRRRRPSEEEASA